MANEVANKEFTTAISKWSNALTNLVTKDFSEVGVPFDDDNKRCALHAVESIFHLVTESGKDMKSINTSNLREIVERCASLKLDAASMPRECYFQIRNKKMGTTWVPTVEMGVEGAGYEALLRNHGVGVSMVYPTWIVKEGDDFIFPRRRGLDITPPEWEEKGLSNKVVRVVVPVKMVDGSVQYLMADRDSVKVNLFAHVRNNLMNETFGICADRYKATDKQKKEIAEKKQVIFDALAECQTVDDMMACKEAREFMSPAWTDSTEAMITRKMINNCVKRFPKSLNTLAHRATLEMSEEYQTAQEEIAENENAEELIVVTEEGEVIDEV